ncbi:hypothetical protein V7139_20710 [Neobacillus drentensis]|jgi:hypothetical protein|uniref:hypothetical protein n=1 Tax=Neobacillus drentensis TaxID=220684 RepID=UPI002FFF44F4
MTRGERKALKRSMTPKERFLKSLENNSEVLTHFQTTPIRKAQPKAERKRRGRAKFIY